MSTTGRYGTADSDRAANLKRTWRSTTNRWAALLGSDRRNERRQDEGRCRHLFFAWVFVLNGLAFALFALMSRHLTRDLVPSGRTRQHQAVSRRSSALPLYRGQ